MGIWDDIFKSIDDDINDCFKSIDNDINASFKGATEYIGMGKSIIDKIKSKKAKKVKTEREKRALLKEIESLNREMENIKKQAKNDPPGNKNGSYKPWGTW